MIETIKSGTLLTVSTGEYSDYSVHGVFRALKDITYEDLREARKAQPGEYDEYCDIKQIIAFLATQGYIEDVPSLELHLGAYGELDPTIYGAKDD